MLLGGFGVEAGDSSSSSKERRSMVEGGGLDGAFCTRFVEGLAVCRGVASESSLSLSEADSLLFLLRMVWRTSELVRSGGRFFSRYHSGTLRKPIDRKVIKSGIVCS